MARIEILTVGDELVEGRLTDTNAGTMSERLADAGLAVARHTSVGDDLDELVVVLREIAGRSDALLISGGLGPTTDDLTTEGVARAFGRPLLRYPEAVAHLEGFFAARGRPMAPNNLKQADLPEGAALIPNPRGTAVGFRLDAGSCRLFSMPGVPREMEGMLDEAVLPDLLSRLPGEAPRIATLRLFGLGESDAGHRLDGLGSGLPAGCRLTVQYRASFPEIQVRLVVRGGSQELLDSLAEDAAARLGRHVYARGGARCETTLAEVAAAALHHAGATVAIADAFAGGRAAGMLAAATDGREVLAGALVAADRARLADVLGAAEDAAEDAGRAARRLGASLGAAILPDEGGLPVVAVAAPDGPLLERRLELPFDLPRMRVLAAWAALELLRRAAAAPPGAAPDPRNAP